MKKFTSHSPQETQELGRRLASSFTGGEIVAFNGDLGAGKTVFCAGMAQALGSTDAVQSPTFAIANFYRGRIPFAHFDAYRINSLEDLEIAGFFEYEEQRAVIAIEWFENVENHITGEVIRVGIEPMGETIREISIEGAKEF